MSFVSSGGRQPTRVVCELSSAWKLDLYSDLDLSLSLLRFHIIKRNALSMSFALSKMFDYFKKDCEGHFEM